MLLLLVAAAVSLASSDLNRDLSQPWRWTQFSTSSGLPSDQVTEVVELEDGTVWCSTPAGIAWYDGYRWERVTGLAARGANQMVAYDRERVLIFMPDGLHLGGRKGFETLQSLPGALSISVLSDGRILGRTGSGFHLYAAAQWRPWTGSLPALPAGYYRTIIPVSGIPIGSARALL